MYSNDSKTLERIRLLKKLFEDGQIQVLEKHEIYPKLDKGDRLNYLYFTLPVSLNFQRSSPAMWQYAFNTFSDPETNYLFYPEKVVLETREKVQADLTRHKLALQKNKHTDIWIAISTTLNKYYDNDPRKVLEESDYDVAKVIEVLRKTRKKDFPYLSGEKMANYWLFILHKFTDIQLKNLNHISIIPDTHVIKCSEHLGIVKPKSKPEEVAEAWKALLEGTEIMPIDMHSVLWNWSRAKFIPNV